MNRTAFACRSTDVVYSATYLFAIVAGGAKLVTSLDHMDLNPLIPPLIYTSYAFLCFVMARLYIVIHEMDDDASETTQSPFVSIIGKMHPVSGAIERLIRILLLALVICLVKPIIDISHNAADTYLSVQQYVSYASFVMQTKSLASPEAWLQTSYFGAVLFWTCVLLFIWDANAVFLARMPYRLIVERRAYLKSKAIPRMSKISRCLRITKRKHKTRVFLHAETYLWSFLEYIASRVFWDRVVLTAAAVTLCSMSRLNSAALMVGVLIIVYAGYLSWRSITRSGVPLGALLIAIPAFLTRPIWKKPAAQAGRVRP